MTDDIIYATLVLEFVVKKGCLIQIQKEKEENA